MRPCQIAAVDPAMNRITFAVKSRDSRNMTTAIGEELRARYQPPDQLTPELLQLLRKVHRSDTRHSASRPRRSREMWLTDDEPRRIAEISVHFLSS
jgi:hypothetical protein